MFTELSGSWLALIDRDPSKPNNIARCLTTALAELERSNTGMFERWSLTPWSSPALLRAARAGLVTATRTATGPNGCVRLAFTESGPTRPASDPNHVVAAVSDALILNRHRRDATKLRRVPAPERHLFLWVYSSRIDIFRARDEGVPTKPPRLPAEITDLWIAIGAHPVLHWRQAGWTTHDIGPHLWAEPRNGGPELR